MQIAMMIEHKSSNSGHLHRNVPLAGDGKSARPRSISHLIRSLLILLLAVSLTGSAYGEQSDVPDGYQADPLFHIERSKNANIVQYDARVGADGLLDPARPVSVYWIRLAEEGQVRALSWLQKTFAYGFDAKPGASQRTAELKMAAGFGRTISIERDGIDYRAFTRINGKEAWLESIYVKSSKKGLSKNIAYVELRGISRTDGSDSIERLKP